MAATLQEAYEFHLQLRRQRSLKAMRSLFRATIEAFGFTSFACGELNLADRQRVVYYLIDWPEAWQRFYFESGFVERDPLIDALASRHEAFTWSEALQDHRVGKLNSNAARLAAAHGWIDGLVVPISGSSGRVGLVSLAGTRVEDVAAHRAYLSLISMILHAEARALVSQQGFAAPPAGLTRREIECIALVAHGHSDSSIAAQLHIAVSTAHEYVQGAKRRLKVRTRMEMVAVAVALGIIDI